MNVLPFAIFILFVDTVAFLLFVSVYDKRFSRWALSFF